MIHALAPILATHRPPPTLSLPILPVIRAASSIMARLRTDGHQRTRVPAADRGDRNAEVDLWGLLAELIVLQWLEANGVRPCGYHLVADHVPEGSDFVWGRTRCEIKSVPTGKRFLCINERSRISKPFDLLFPVVFDSQETAKIYRPISYDEVARWTLREQHTPYRSIAVGDLKPLYSVAGIVSQMIPFINTERPLADTRGHS